MDDTRTEASDRARRPLLDLITSEALERDYQYAAARTPTGGQSRRRTAVLAVLGAFGLLVAVAAAQTTRNADVDDASRAQVISRIESNRSAQQDAQEELADLRASNATSDKVLAGLSDDLAEAEGKVAALQVSTGFTAVVGEGIRIRFDNREGSDPFTDWVRDTDVAGLVNGLWEAGAEAISVNGERIIGTGGIRNVGTNVEINSRAIAPPYTVLAIGNSDTLPAELLDSTSGQRFFDLAGQYGWEAETVTMNEVRVPAAPADRGRLTSARQIDPNPRGGDAP